MGGNHRGYGRKCKSGSHIENCEGHQIGHKQDARDDASLCYIQFPHSKCICRHRKQSYVQSVSSGRGLVADCGMHLLCSSGCLWTFEVSPQLTDVCLGRAAPLLSLTIAVKEILSHRSVLTKKAKTVWQKQ